MITKEQAGVIADEFIEQQQQIRNDERNAKAPRVPHVYRMTELEAFEPWQRIELLRTAELNVGNQPRCLAAMLIAFFAWVALAMGWNSFDALPPIPSALIGVGAILVPMYIRVIFVRRELRNIATTSATA